MARHLYSHQLKMILMCIFLRTTHSRPEVVRDHISEQRCSVFAVSARRMDQEHVNKVRPGTCKQGEAEWRSLNLHYNLKAC